MSRILPLLRARALAAAGLVLLLPKCALCVFTYLALGAGPELCGDYTGADVFGDLAVSTMSAIGLSLVVAHCLRRHGLPSGARSVVR